ncbi:unnamed protein product [Meganyctiphanes norvegica]|uniref:Uncharacterized protein n=1 Tax=Meganyctiphanes norvegica TaxID=48144 RepID=A0AAV2SI15_MEGNR
MFLCSLFSALALFSILGCSSGLECPELFEEVDGSCFYFSSNLPHVKGNWTEAREYCQNLGNELKMLVDLAELSDEHCQLSKSLIMAIADHGKTGSG